MNSPKILRIRYIPDEIVDISGDSVVYRDKDFLVTKWVPINPRTDFSKGVSYTFLDKGWKISKFINETNEQLYWYCDIIDAKYDEEKDEYKLYDLLIDIRINKDGSVEVLDLDELAEALGIGMIDVNQAKDALIKSDSLLKIVYSEGINRLLIKKFEEKKIGLI